MWKKAARALIARGVFVTTLLSASSAFAFCRTTTCDPSMEQCPRDQNGCVTNGLPLYWPDLCVTFGVQYLGSPKRNISFELANQVATEAFRSWISADCGETEPSIGVVPRGEIVCDEPEFNVDPPAPNANVIMFRDDKWPYEGARTTIALTTITFDVDTGEILDADIEVNSANMELSVGDTNVMSDLQSVLTHEVGHFLGLAHSPDRHATMNANYDRGDISFRTLSEDDKAGICTVYPPGLDLGECQGAQPRYGFSRFCGSDTGTPGACSLVASKMGNRAPIGVWVTLGLAALGLTRRRRRH